MELSIRLQISGVTIDWCIESPTAYDHHLQYFSHLTLGCVSTIVPIVALNTHTTHWYIYCPMLRWASDQQQHKTHMGMKQEAQGFSQIHRYTYDNINDLALVVKSI